MYLLKFANGKQQIHDIEHINDDDLIILGSILAKGQQCGLDIYEHFVNDEWLLVLCVGYMSCRDLSFKNN